MTPRTTLTTQTGANLMASPEMRQALRVLQLPITDLAGLVQTEVEHNPLLEINEEQAPTDEIERIQEEALEDETEEPLSYATEEEQRLLFDDQDYSIFRKLDDEFRRHFGDSELPRHEPIERTLENRPAPAPSLFDYLMQQAHQTFDDDYQLAIATAIIGNLDDAGFLASPLDDLPFPDKAVHEVLKAIQTFSPSGIGTQDLRHALLLQLEQKGESKTLAYQLISEHFDDLMHKRINTIAQAMNLTPANLHTVIEQQIAPLNFYPGTLPSQPFEFSSTPDLLIVQEEDRFTIKTNREPFSGLRLNRKYLDLLSEAPDSQTREFAVRYLGKARWLLRTLMQRSDTLERVGQVLFSHQQDYLLDPGGVLHPLTMKQVADELQIAESTVARAVAGKTIAAPRGLIAMRSLFTNGYKGKRGRQISAQAVKARLAELIADEDKTAPLSDTEISEALAQEGITCARRTIAKYRNQLGFPPAKLRTR